MNESHHGVMRLRSGNKVNLKPLGGDLYAYTPGESPLTIQIDGAHPGSTGTGRGATRRMICTINGGGGGKQEEVFKGEHRTSA